jgi:hypothetical protein
VFLCREIYIVFTKKKKLLGDHLENRSNFMGNNYFPSFSIICITSFLHYSSPSNLYAGIPTITLPYPAAGAEDGSCPPPPPRNGKSHSGFPLLS